MISQKKAIASINLMTLWINIVLLDLISSNIAMTNYIPQSVIFWQWMSHFDNMLTYFSSSGMFYHLCYIIYQTLDNAKPPWGKLYHRCISDFNPFNMGQITSLEILPLYYIDSINGMHCTISDIWFEIFKQHLWPISRYWHCIKHIWVPFIARYWTILIWLVPDVQCQAK